MFEAAIFDWDGTLADTRHAIVTSFHRALSEEGLDVSTEFIERRIGIGASQTFREIIQAKGLAVDEEMVKRLVAKKSEAQIALAGEVHLLPGARELLEALQGKMKVALASMNNGAVVARLLKITDLTRYFQVVVTVDKVSRSKPDPEIFLKAAQELGVAAAGCVVFEDSIFGVKAAAAAGMGCVAVTTGVYSVGELKKEGPALVVETLRDVRIVPFVLKA